MNAAVVPTFGVGERKSVYGVPSDLDLQAFVGSSLDQIRLGAHQISFHFSGPGGGDSASLAVEGRWVLVNAGGTPIDESIGEEETPDQRDSYRVHKVLGRSVVAFSLDPPRSLTLRFDDGAQLTVWDDSDQFESFHVEPGGYHV